MTPAAATKPLSVPQSVVRGTAVLAGLQLLEQLTGFGSQSVVAALFGATARTDAYFVACSVISLLTIWFTVPVEQVAIPIFRHDLSRRGEAAAWQGASVLLCNLMVLASGVAAFAWCLAPHLVSVVGLGFDIQSKALATSLTRCLLVIVVMTVVADYLAQLLLSYERFALSGIAGIAENVVFAAVLFALGATIGVYALAVAMLIAVAVHVVFRLPILWQHRANISLRVDFRHHGMREMRRLGAPSLLSAAGMQAARVADRLFASLLSAGSISALAFALLLIEIPNRLLLQPVQRATFPHFTRLISEENYDEFSRQLFQALRLLFFLAVPATIGLMLVSDLIVRVAFQRGAFDDTAVGLTSRAVFFYAIGLPATFLSRMLDQTFYSLKETRTPMLLTWIRIGSKILLMWILIPALALAGIALAESLSQILRLCAYLCLLPSAIRREDAARTVAAFARTLASTAAMAVVMLLAKTSPEGTLAVTLHLAELVGMGLGSYLLASWVVQPAEMEWFGRSLLAVRGRT
jgi:putative peptidoglycan lipid II flippase